PPAQAAPGRAYVTNPDSDRVSVIDTATNTVVNTIPVGDRPVGVALTPDGARVYAVNVGDGTVSVISTASDTVVATVAMGGSPHSVTVTPDGARAWVYGNGPARVIDTSSNTVVGTVPGAALVEDVAFSPDGTRAYLAEQTAGLLVVDTATLATLAVRYLGFLAREVAVSPDGSRVYVGTSRNLYVFETAWNIQVAFVDVPAGVTDLVFSPDGARLYVGQYFPGAVVVLNPKGEVWQVDRPATLAVVATVPLQNHTANIDVSPAGDRLYVTVGPVVSEGVVVIDTATNTVVTLIPIVAADVAVTAATPPLPPVIEGATFFTDGTSARTAAPGARVSLFTSSGVPGVDYRLVLSRDNCRTVVAVLNHTPRFANSSGVIGPTAGNVPAGTAPGRYQVCFRGPVGGTASVTGPVTLDVV
ncbi:MAG: hypothetical protein LC708_00525, partial [Actinobacteria bacterium]|nr:hypothetical protein [Actinomycetota bacterium]